MKKPWILPVVGLLTIVFALGAVACSDDEETAGSDDATATTEVMSDTPEPTGDTAGTPAATGPTEVDMHFISDDTVAGTALVSSIDGDVSVVVNIPGELEPGTRQSHIHHGACADPTGPIHVNLESIEADATGAGSATTENPADEDGAVPPYEHYTSVAHYIAVHAEDGSVVVCGDVPMM